MKKLLLVLFIVLMSCSSDKSNCDAEVDYLMEYWGNIIREARERGASHRRIDILKEERDARIFRVCR